MTESSDDRLHPGNDSDAEPDEESIGPPQTGRDDTIEADSGARELAESEGAEESPEPEAESPETPQTPEKKEGIDAGERTIFDLNEGIQEEEDDPLAPVGSVAKTIRDSVPELDSAPAVCPPDAAALEVDPVSVRNAVDALLTRHVACLTCANSRVLDAAGHRVLQAAEPDPELRRVVDDPESFLVEGFGGLAQAREALREECRGRAVMVHIRFHHGSDERLDRVFDLLGGLHGIRGSIMGALLFLLHPPSGWRRTCGKEEIAGAPLVRFDFLAPLLRSHVDDRRRADALIEDLVAQRVGGIVEDEVEFSDQVLAALHESADALEALTRKTESSAPTREQGRVHRTALAVALHLPGLTVHQFDLAIRCLLADRVHEWQEEKVSRVTGADAEVEKTISESVTRSADAFEYWDEHSAEVMASCGLAYRDSASGGESSVRIVQFRTPAIRKEAADRIDERFRIRVVDELVHSDLLFGEVSDPSLTDLILHALRGQVSRYPDRYDEGWLAELLAGRSNREARGDSAAPATPTSARNRILARLGGVAEILLDHPRPRDSVRAFLRRFLTPEAYWGAYVLVRELAWRPGFDTWGALRRLLDVAPTDSLLRRAAIRLLLQRSHSSFEGMWEVLGKIREWIPERESPRLTGAQVAARDFVVPWFSSSTRSYLDLREQGRPCAFLLFEGPFEAPRPDLEDRASVVAELLDKPNLHAAFRMRGNAQAPGRAQAQAPDVVPAVLGFMIETWSRIGEDVGIRGAFLATLAGAMPRDLVHDIRQHWRDQAEALLGFLGRRRDPAGADSDNRKQEKEWKRRRSRLRRLVKELSVSRSARR